MPSSGQRRLIMSQPGATNESLKGDYNKKVGAMMSKNVHNQPKSRKGSGKK